MSATSHDRTEPALAAVAEALHPAGRQATERPEALASPAVRAQLLATEHWSLLATRSMTWAEILGRISIHLTVSSAALVVLALTGQATSFGTPFRVLAIGLASAVLVLGTLTGIRVHNASADDAIMVVGMNRLRAAYRELDPDIERFLVASWHDDQAGVLATYTLGLPRRQLSHSVGSTTMFMNVVNAMGAGTLGALIAEASGLGTAAVATVGTLAGLGYLGLMLELGRRTFSGPVLAARFPTTAP